MKRRIVYFLITLLMAFCAARVHAEVEFGSGVETGSGIRALALANNHVAAANDLSAVYWNPAILAMLPVREVQASFDMLSIGGVSEVSGGGITIPRGASGEDYIQRLRISGLGAMFAIPTTQGGLTLAFSFDRPYIFDDVSVYTYNNVLYDTLSSDGRAYGDLNRWNLAFGAQVTEQISAGVTVSMVTGRRDIKYRQADIWSEYVKIDDTTYYGGYVQDADYVYNYLGLTLTGGLLYYPIDILRVGLRINSAMNIGVEESRTITTTEYIYDVGYGYDSLPDRIGRRATGRAHTAPNGTIGTAVKLPWLTAALDLRATLPYTFVMPGEKIPNNVQAKYYKLGAGVGVEVPLSEVPVVFRAGYSLDEHDLFPIIHKYDKVDINWESAGMFSADGLKHTATGGMGVFTSGVGFELTYAFQAWGLNHDNGTRVLNQKYSNHRVATAIIFRY